MTEFVFTVKEVDRGGYIAWDAIEDRSGHTVELKSRYLVAGTYPDIQEHLKQHHQIDVEVAYTMGLGNKLEGLTWTYVRGDHTIIIHDMPRAIFRLYGLKP